MVVSSEAIGSNIEKPLHVEKCVYDQHTRVKGKYKEEFQREELNESTLEHDKDRREEELKIWLENLAKSRAEPANG